MREYYVYRYTRLDTNTPFYIGKGKNDRWSSKASRNNYFLNIINSVPYEVEIILDNLTEQEAYDKEVEFIKLYRKLGYCQANLTNGGEGTPGWVLTEEISEKMAAAKRGKPMSEEKKRVFNMKGRHHSEETKEKMRMASLGQVMSEEARKKMSIAKKGTKASPETRLKMSLSHSNVSEETRRKLSEATKRVWEERKKNKI